MQKIAVIDFETDPFRYKQQIMPFAGCFYDGDRTEVFWNEKRNDPRYEPPVVSQLIAYLKSLPESYIIYAHNGGKFDFYFMLRHLAGECRIVQGRIVQAYVAGHELRDSFAAVPAPLRAYKKDEMTEDDYLYKFTWPRRNFYRDEITRYMIHDCEYLYELMTAFIDEFGNKITIGSASMEQLQNFHKFQRMVPEVDDAMRSFFFGGRTQCFETGVINDELKVYDVNSMYPYVMKAFEHPTSSFPKLVREINHRTFFAKIDAINDGALPKKRRDGTLDFTIREGTFYATIHEINAGLETKTLQIQKLHYAVNFDRTAHFADFVDHFYNARLSAKKLGDDLHVLFYKLVLNSAYGKFAQNPADFFDYWITDGELMPVCSAQCREDCREHWSYYENYGPWIIWRKRPDRALDGFYNVATAASITGAARAVLLRGLARAERPVYCDTDSIVCRRMGADFDNARLGAWKLEATGDQMAIAGKKLYALTNGGAGVKKAHKGARLTFDEVISIARGQEIEWANPVPRFGLNGSQTFIKRKVKLTGENVSHFKR